NMARMGTATQSSTYENGIPGRANDGSKNTNYYGLSCSHTMADKRPWWRLDLKVSRAINIVVLTNRLDCCSERLKWVQVRIGDSLKNQGRICVTFSDVYSPGATVGFCCYGMKGRYVTVFIPNRREFLTLCEVEVLESRSGDKESPLPNMSGMGTATQSSVYKIGIAKHAIDGNKNGNHRKLSCSHTRADKSPWWRLDLQTTRTIMTVVITNRADCCSNRLRNVEVRVGNSLQNEGRDNYNINCYKGATVRFCCYGASGRYVTVFIPNRREFLTLCEVEVFGILPYSSLQNIARMGTATQSSAYKNGIAKHAIDGNKNGNHRKLSCSHTRADRSPWWRLDLQTTRTIMTVVITNRADCCSNRLRNVEVRVGNSLQNEGRDNYKCVPEKSVTLPGATVRFCCYGASGRYVTVFIPNRREFLTLCEVEVFGILPYSISGVNIARMGTATQSSEYKTGLAKHAIDGNKNTNHRQLSCSHTKADKSPWWRLDLQTTRTIMTVVLTNRVDCCSNRLRNVEVRVGNSLKNKFPVCGCASLILPGATVGFCCYGASGRYVTVFIPNRREFLTLCEVEVFGILP
uniref:Fucolectin tachylectin-4 pentraxin-1 domain-containing protein n=1 Tax=Latimeria chalumnae TaxID=7897 RepID=H3ALS4_LATCH